MLQSSAVIDAVRRGLPALLVLLWSALARAEVVPNLYQASVAVSDQSAAELHRAAGVGLAEVLVRVSGHSDADRNPALAAALANAERYLDQYRYERAAGTAPGTVAKLNYAAGPVDQLVRGAGLPLWGANRPSVLVWLALDDGKSRGFVREAGNPELVAALREQARRRGLALRFPLLDGGDLSAVSTDDVWRLDAAKVQPAAERYRADALLLGHLLQLPGGRWQGAWALTVNGQRSNGENDGDSLAGYLAPGIDRVADMLAAQYAVATTGAPSEGLLLRLVGVANFHDYARALGYLQQLGAIKAVSPVQIRGDEIFLRLKVDGSVEQLTRQLALDNRLAPQLDPAATGPGGQPVQLQYRWIPPAEG